MTIENGKMTQKTALVTGATAGIGQAAARAFVGAGWRVIGTGRRADRLDALEAELGDAFIGLTFDIRDDRRARCRAGRPAGRSAIDLLINNAGLALGARAGAGRQARSTGGTMIDTNVTALVAITHKLLPGIVARKGAIINLSSVAASYPYPGGNVYAGTKAFVRQFSLDLRADLAGTGVRVTAIEPGMVETEFTLVRTGSQEASDTLYAGIDPMTAEDIAATMLWVAQQPPHLNINALELMPVNQSWQGFAVARTPASDS